MRHELCVSLIDRLGVMLLMLLCSVLTTVPGLPELTTLGCVIRPRPQLKADFRPGTGGGHGNFSENQPQQQSNIAQ